MINILRRFAYSFVANESTFFIVVAVIIGIFAGLLNFLFVLAYETLYQFVVVPLWGTPMVLGALLGGGLILILISYLFPPSTLFGYGFPKFLEQINIKGGLMKAKDTFGKAFGAIITLGFGGSAGQEGPIAQLGGGIGSGVSKILKVSRNHSRVFIACGVSGAIAATFNAPIAAVLFAEEIALIRNFRITSFLPIVIASALGTITSRALRGNTPLFSVPPYQFTEYKEFLFYALFGLALGVFSFLFIRLFHKTNDLFSNLKIGERTKPLIGALMIGCMAIFFPYIMGNGYDHVNKILNNELPIMIIIGLIILKPIATSITIGSGWPGGIFAPALFIGAALGGVYGMFVGNLISSPVELSSAYATIGMGTFLAAVTQAPLTSIFLIFELTQNYQVVIPIMITSVLASAMSRYLAGGSLESIQLKKMGIEIEEGLERHVLRSIRVEDIMIHEIETIPENMTLRTVIENLPKCRHTTFPLVDENGLLSGIISIQDFKEWIFEEPLKDIVIVKELATINVVTVTPDDTLDIVLDKWGKNPVEILPVVDAEAPKKIIGVLSRRDVIGAYNKALSEKILEGGG